MKKILPFLTALLFLLSSCTSPNDVPDYSDEVSASASASMSVEDTSESMPEEEENKFDRDPLNAYPLHYGEAFTYKVSCAPESDEYFFECPDIPTDPIGCSVMDFDADGADELMLISAVSVPENSGKGWNEYTLRMSMFEEENDGYRLSADRILSEEEIYLPWSTFSDDLFDGTRTSVFADCYTYGEEDVTIAVETSDYASLFSDGITRGFAAYTYTGDSFEVQANDSLCGSSFEDEDTEPFAIMLADAGIELNWDDFLEQKTYISNHVLNYNCLLYVEFSPLCSYEEVEEWKESRNETLDYASASIYTKSEMAERSDEMKYIMPLPSRTMPAFQASTNQMLKAYINALENFVYNAVFPDGEEMSTVNSIPDEQFAICDVDDDGEDELIIKCSHETNRDLLVHVFRYDSDTGEVTEQLEQHANSIFFGHKYVTVPPFHNDSMSEFWPYTLYEYDAKTDSYQFLGFVMGLDKGAESRTPYQYDASIDTNHNGRIYCIIESYEDDDGFRLVDDAGYKKWHHQYIGDRKELAFNWMNTTAENIYSLLE